MRRTAFARLAQQIINKFAIGTFNSRRREAIYRTLAELYKYLTFPAYDGPNYKKIIADYMVNIQSADAFHAEVDATALANHINNEIYRGTASAD